MKTADISEASWRQQKLEVKGRTSEQNIEPAHLVDVDVVTWCATVWDAYV